MENIVYNINSEFRDKSIYPESNNFSINLLDNYKNVSYIRLTSIELPNVAPIFKDRFNNNTFILSFITDNRKTNAKINIGEGNHTHLTLYKKIKKKMDIINTRFGTHIELDIDVTSSKIKFISDIEININFGSSTLNKYLGFNNSSYDGKIIEGENMIYLIDSKYIFLRINNIDNIYDNRVNNVFTKIILNTDKYTYNFQGQNLNSTDKFFRGPINLNKFNIELVDYLGNPLDLNNYEFSLTLEFGYIYDIELYNKLYKGGIPHGDDNRLKIFYR